MSTFNRYAALLLFLCLLYSGGRWQAHGEESTRAPLQPARPAESKAPADSDFNLELQRDPTGLIVRLQNFFKLMGSLFERPVMHWDPASGTLRVQEGGHTITLSARASEIVVDGKPQRTARPLLIRQGNVLIPVESVERVLKSLGVEFEYNSKSTAPTTTFTPVSSIATVPPAPSASPIVIATATPAQTPVSTATITPTPVLTAAPTPTPDASAAAGEIPRAPAAAMVLPVLDAGDTAVPPTGENMALQPPPQVGDKVSLSWGQLIDVAHRRPPERLVIVCDSGVEAVARRAAEVLREQPQLAVEVVSAAGKQRDQDALASEIAGRRPELMVDLQQTPQGPGSNQITIWTVHEALWPGDGGRGGDEAALRYHKHQFQNLALGSLLRVHLTQDLPGTRPQYELAPSFLLRRTDAPCAAVLIGEGVLPDEAARERAARSVADAMRAYIKGMAGVQF